VFQHINIQQQRMGDADHPLDIGFLVEAMLFYGRVDVVVSRAGLRQLVRTFGPELLLEFLARGHMVVQFERNFTGVVTENHGTPAETCMLTVAQIERQDLLDVLLRILLDIVGRPGRSRRLSRALASRIAQVRIDDELRLRVAEDLKSPGYLNDAVHAILETYVPGKFPSDAKFEIIPVEAEKFRIGTNLDFAALNEIYHQRVPATHSSLDVAYILSHIMEARKMLENSANSDAELAVSPVYSRLTSLKLESAIYSRQQSSENIDAFQNLVFENGRNIADTVNSDPRRLEEVLPVLNRAERFRDWLRKRQPDADLVKEYFRAVTSDSWIDKLPNKFMRWSLFTGAGIVLDILGAGGIATATGVALGAADTFLVDRIVKGWKPDRFVNASLKEFVQK
jgi:AcrR family transcriptional regulator